MPPPPAPGARPRDGGADAATAGPVTVTAAAALATTLAVLPVFLFGALSALVRADIEVPPSAVGMLTGAFFAAASVSSIPAGRLAERIGERASLLLGISVSATSLLGIATLGTTAPVVGIFLIVGGMANGLVQPSVNLALSRRVGTRIQGVAFGVKQAAIPVATLLGGAAVPAVGLTLGWRWAFAGAGMLVAPVIVLVLRATRSTGRARAAGSTQGGASRPSMRGRGLLPLAIGGAFGAGGANALGAFHVDTLVQAGLPLGQAGLWLSLGSMAGIAARLMTGFIADRIATDQVRVVGAMLAGGAVGFVGLATASTSAGLLFASLLAFAAGWGWPGLLHLAVVRENARWPGAASGVAQTGLYLGGVAGPICFGLLAERASYDLAWLMIAGFGAVGALAMLVRRRPPPHED